jgi:tyrosinase
MFIYWFERIVRAAVVESGGSSDWALPFWNYGVGGEQATLPPAFRSPTQGNPLYVPQRDPDINSGLALSPLQTSADQALARPFFTGPTQFGGGITPAQQFSASPGQLELTPHNAVHGGVGGWMNNPDEAAQDPIFWLHHSNIDRLWFIWATPSHVNPNDPGWIAQKFGFFDEAGARVEMTPADVLDIEGQLGYTYEVAPPAKAVPTPPPIQPPTPIPPEPLEPMPPPIPQPPEPPAGTPAPLEPETPPQPEIVGSSREPVRLIGEQVTVEIAIDARAVEQVIGQGSQPTHVYLGVDDIEGKRDPGRMYAIYVNLPRGDSYESARSHYAGNLSFFGLARARNPRGDEQTHNLQVIHSISLLVQQLSTAGEWDGRHLAVTFRPVGLIPHDRPDLAHAEHRKSHEDAPVTLGRVSILYA